MGKKEENMSELRDMVSRMYAEWAENFITEEAALRPDLAGMRIFDAPLLGISDAADPLYTELKREHVVGPWHRTPEEWLPGAKCVVSLFFPFAEQVRLAQRKETEKTSPEWLHARIEGNSAMLSFAGALRDRIRSDGYLSLVPALEPAFATVINGKGSITGYPGITEKTFGSNWSERHVAFISGLGTFGLSRGLITQRGMAGRFVSIITDRELAVTRRSYTRFDEWCTRCGACVRRCPVGAITLEKGKDHIPCGRRINESKVRYAPRYGCGQCQTAVPCEAESPVKQTDARRQHERQ